MKLEAWTIAAAAALLLLPALGARDLWAPDEPRYAQVAEELRSGAHGPRGLVLLHLNGEAYTQKPPLYFWAAAAAGAAGGHVGEWAARLPSALAGIATVWLTARWGTALLGRPGGLLGAALLLTVFDFARFARRAQLDVLLALFETAALAAFARGFAAGRWTRRDLAWLHAALGLAVLVKGPVGWIVPLLAMAAALAWERRAGALRRLLPPWALALSLGPGLLWLGAAALLAPAGYLGEAVGTNLFGRFFAGTSHARPLTYFFYQLPLNFLPWTLLAPLAAWAGARRVFAPGGPPAPGTGPEARARAWRLLLCVVAASFVFFSLSAGKRWVYLLPCFPAAALLCGDAVVLALAGRSRWPRWAERAAAALLAALTLLCVGAPWVDARFSVALPGSLAAAGLALAVAAWLAWRRAAAAREPALARAAVAVGVVLGFELAVFALALPALDPQKSPRPVAEAAAALTPRGAAIGLLGPRSLTGGLAYYGDRRVAQLATPQDVARFLGDGGRAVVLRARDLEGVTDVVPVSVRGRFREGRRALLLVAAAPSP